MNIKKEVIKDILFYGIGLVCIKLVVFILLPMITKYIPPADYGYFELINTSINLLIPIISIQIGDAIFRYLANDNLTEEERKQYIENGAYILLRNIFIISIIVMLLNITGLVGGIQYFNIAFVWLVLSVINAVILLIVRGINNNKVFFYSGILFLTINLGINIYNILNGNMSVYSLIISNIFAFLISNVYIVIRLKLYKIRVIRNKEMQKKLTSYSIPLIFNSISWWVTNVSDRYIISHYLNNHVLGIYSSAARFSVLLTFMYSIFYIIWQRYAFKYSADNYDKDFFTRTLNVLVTVFLSIVIISIFVSKPIIQTILSGEYINCYKLIPALLLATSLSSLSSFYGIGYLLNYKTKNTFYTSLVAAILSLSINLIFMPIYGIGVAVMANMVAFLTMWVVRMINMRKYFFIPIKAYNLVLFVISLYSIVYVYKG